MADASQAEPIGKAGLWLETIEKADKKYATWRRRVRKIIKKYSDQRGDKESSSRKYAMLWANTSTLQPVVYARVPQPVVIRRFKDKDRVARNAGDMVERALVTMMEQTDFDGMMRNVRDDYLLAARGTSWERYEADFEPITDETGQPVMDEQGKPAERVVAERSITDYVNWSDFGHSIARRWEEVTAVWRRVFMGKAAVAKRFGADIAGKISYEHKVEGDDAKDVGERDKKAVIFEIWDKASGKVLWVTKGYAEVLDEIDPPLTVKGFFPCPKPAYGTTVTDSLEPYPDYIFYQDQAEQIDALTAKIDRLTDSLKLVGFYPAAAEGTKAIIKAMSPESTDLLIPVTGWQSFAEKGGAANAIQWVPIETVMKVIEGCQNVRSMLIQNIYEITGMSDIVRGASDPNETATAQQIKNQWGSIRVRDRQAEIQRFARDAIRIKAEVVAEKFQPETLMELTGLKFPTKDELAQQQAQQAMMGHNGGPPMQGQAPQGMPPQAMPGQPQQPMAQPAQAMAPTDNPEDAHVTIDDIVQLLRDDKLRSYRLDIESDSTVVPDEQADKDSWNELLGEVSNFMTNAMPIGQTVPEMVPVLGEMLLATIRKYRAGKSLEDSVETAIGQLIAKAKAQQNAPPQPGPDQMKAEAEIKMMQEKLQMEGQSKQQDMALKQKQMEMDQQAHGMEQTRMANEHQQKMAMIQNEHQVKQASAYGDIALRMKQHQADQAATQQKDAAAQQDVAQGADASKLMMSAADEIANAMKEVAQAIVQSGEQNTQAIVAAVSKPKRIVHDPQTGRPIGAETVN